MTTALLLALLGSAPVAQVELRGGRTLDEPVIAVSLEGVTTQPAIGGVVRSLPWDLVKNVSGEHAQEAAQFQPVADKAWRARARLARADIDAAEPLYADLFSQYRAHAGPTSQRIADGWLRCCLSHADRLGALDAWAVCLSLQGADAGAPPDSFDPGEFSQPAIDPETDLAAALPPIWDDERTIRAVAERDPLSTAPMVRAMERWYQLSAQVELDPRTPLAAPDAVPETTDAVAQAFRKGAELLRAMVESRSADARLRVSARDRLDAGLESDIGTWREAWRRVALGRSLLMEKDPSQRSDGVFHLMHLPARFATTQPYLCSIAAGAIAKELSTRAKDEAAAALRLAQEFGAAAPPPSPLAPTSRDATPTPAKGGKP